MAEQSEPNRIKPVKARRPVPAVLAGLPSEHVDAVEPVAQMAEATSMPTEAPPQSIEPVAPNAVTSPAPTNELISGPAATTVPTSEGSVTMATVVPPSPTDAAEKAQNLFGDASTRFKTAFEKSSKLGEEMVDFAKGNVEALLASSRVAAKAAETLGQEAADYSKKSFENATTAFKSFASVKSPTELFTLQSEFMKASFDSAVAEASKISETMLKLAGDVAQPLSTRYALAAEKFKSTTL